MTNNLTTTLTLAILPAFVMILGFAFATSGTNTARQNLGARAFMLFFVLLVASGYTHP